jgi:HlyD family secretion protein
MMGFLCAIPILGGLLAPCAPPAPLAAGYVEGEYVLVAPIETARLNKVDVERGDRVKAGEMLAEMDKRDAEIAVAQAKANLAQAESQLANLLEGKRPEEIAAIEASLNSAKAQEEEAERVLKRQADLLSRGIAAQASFDDAQTSVRMARAKVAELEANLAVAKLPARENEIKAAEAAKAQAAAALDNAKWRLDNRNLTTSKDGTVYDIVRRPGELAGPQAPVLSVLPDGAVKLKVYVGERQVSEFRTGMKIDVHCDGCPQGMTATVSYVATDPEFTPPVIYSLENRQKLVYLIEARPDPGASALKPGQIVDISLPEAGS